MATKLMRADLRDLYEAAQDVHLGLQLQRGLKEHDENNKEAKTEYIECVCQSRASDFYKRTYNRWKQATTDINRFRRVFMELETRLFIGLTGGGMLETGCAISRSHGMPYIPGSSVKGVVNAYARARLGNGGADICDELFGTEELSGLISFHDAWWVPDSADRPLVQEVVTSHHPDYYSKDGAKPATDFDSPVPNAQVAVQGGFLFVLEGPLAWLELAEEMLIDALSTHGAGAKTRAGYGLFREDAERREQEKAERQAAQKEAEKQAQKEAEKQQWEGLSEGRRRIKELKLQVEIFSGAEGQARKSIRERVATAANRLTEKDFTWTDNDEREEAAKALEECYKKIGWSNPNKKTPEQKKKQKERRRKDIEEIRQADGSA